MDITVWITFIVASVIFSIAPGAGAIASINNTLQYGIKGFFIGVVGLQFALCFHLIIVSLGLGALLSSSALAFSIIKYVGAVYLIYLGISKLLSKRVVALDPSVDQSKEMPLKLIRQGFIVNLLNPKSIVFLAAFLPQFVDPSRPIIMQYCLLGCTVLFIDTLAMFFYSLTAYWAKRYASSPTFMLWQERVFGGVFCSLGVSLAASQR
jgi:homoserine/homoserine lactone efflux protein